MIPYLPLFLCYNKLKKVLSMKKTLKYFNSLEHTAMDILKELPDSTLEQMESLILHIHNKNIKIEPFSDKTITNAKKYIKFTAQKRKSLLGKDDKEIAIFIFPILYMLTKSYISCKNIIEDLWFSSNLPYKAFAAQTLQNLYAVSADDVLPMLYSFLKRARLCKL